MSTKYTCCKNVGKWLIATCGKTAKYERDGRHYCGIHDPVTRQAKNAKRDTEWRVKYDANKKAAEKLYAEKKEIERRAECFPELLEALQNFDALIKHQYSGSQEAMSDLTDAAQAAKNAILKALGEQA